MYITALWLAGLLHVARREIIAALLRPYDGLPSRVDRLDSALRNEDILRVVVRLEDPVQLLSGRLVWSRKKRRDWLVNVVKGLPAGERYSYIFHWFASGQRVLSSDPGRGLLPPPRRASSIRDRVLAAYVGHSDVTDTIRAISASFHDSEAGEVCPRALDAYLRHAHGLSIAEEPLVVTDGKLGRKSYTAS